VYKIFTTHNTFRNSTLNDGHGLKWILREHCGFDIGIKAHNHKPHLEEFILRGKTRYIIGCSSYKGQDRHSSKEGFPPTKLLVPGILLHPKRKEIIGNIDYRELKDYL
jgi:hypothetical protein